MSRGLTPPLDERPPAFSWPRAGLAALGALAVAKLFWAPLLLGGALQGHDWTSHHFGYFDWVRMALTGYGTLPFYMADAWVTPNFLGNAEAPSLGPLTWLLFVLPAGVYLKVLIVAFTAVGLAGTFLLLRDLDVAPSLAAFGAVAFSFGGFFTAHIGVGHPWAMGGWLLPLLLLLVRRAVLGSVGAGVAAAALNALTVMGGQHQPFIWQNLLLSMFAVAWAIAARSLRPALVWGAIAVGAAALGAVKIVPMAIEFADYAPTNTVQGMPVASLPATLLAWGQGPDRVDPRIAFEHGAGWWEYAFYVGPLALLALLVGCTAARGAGALLLIGVFFLALSLEPGGAWDLLADLPVWRSQRGPSRFLFLTLFALSVAGAMGLERLRRRAAPRLPHAAVAVPWVLAVVVALDLFAQSLPWQHAATGPAVERIDHRPRPLELRSAGGTATLLDFAPNHLSYRVISNGRSPVVVPLRFGKRLAEWEAEGVAGPDPAELRLSSRQGKLALDVPEGEWVVDLGYRPPGLGAGAATSGLTVVALAVWMILRRRSRPDGGQDAD